MSDVKFINDKLKATFGTELDGSPKFRLVWSDSQFEYRKGTFNDFYGKLFVRSFTGIRRTFKYSYIKERWILEVKIPPIPNDELVDQNGYEPLYVFESSKGEYLQPLWEVCKIIIYHILNPDMNPLQRKEMYEELERKQVAMEVDYFKDAMEDANPIMASRLKAGEAILNPFENKEN